VLGERSWCQLSAEGTTLPQNRTAISVEDVYDDILDATGRSLWL